MLAKTPCTASISGTAGRLEIDGWFYQPNTVRLLDSEGRELDRYEPPVRDHGLAYEAAEFARLLAAGKTESDLLPLDETLRIMQALDEVRRAARRAFSRRGLNTRPDANTGPGDVGGFRGGQVLQRAELSPTSSAGVTSAVTVTTAGRLDRNRSQPCTLGARHDDSVLVCHSELS